MKLFSHATNVFDLLESRSMLAADLAVAISPITITDPGTTAELIRFSGTLTNVGDASYEGGGALRFLLSADDIADAGDLEIGFNYLGPVGINDVPIYDHAIPRPTTAQVPAGTYKILATIALPDGSTDNLANNTAASVETVQIGDVVPPPPPPPPPTGDTFGLVNGKRVTLTKTLTTGQVAVFKLDGPGSGSLTQVNGEWLVTLTGTTNDSVFKVRRAEGATTDPVINGISVTGDVGHIHMHRADLDGDVTVTGAIRRLLLDDVSNGTITIGGISNWTHFQADTLTDMVVRSEGEFAVFKVNNWTSRTDSPDQLIADRIQVLMARNFAADLILSNGTGKALWVAGIRNITGGTWNITGTVNNIYARNIAEGWEMGVNGTLKSLRVDGSLNNVSVSASNIDQLHLRGGTTNSLFIAGANLGSDARLGGIDSAADTFAGGTIKKIDIRGGATNTMFIAGVNPTDATFGNADDAYLSPSLIRQVQSRGTLTNTLFIAQNAPGEFKHIVPPQNHGGGNNNDGNSGNNDRDDDNRGRNNNSGRGNQNNRTETRRGGGLFGRR